MIYQYVSINYGDGYPTGISTYLLDAKDPFPSYEWDYNYASLPKYWDQNNSTFYTDGQADFATSPDGIYVFRYEVRKNRITMKINKKPVIGKRYGKLLEGVLFEDEYALPWKSRPLFGFASYQTFEYGLSRIEMGPLQ